MRTEKQRSTEPNAAPDGPVTHATIRTSATDEIRVEKTYSRPSRVDLREYRDGIPTGKTFTLNLIETAQLIIGLRKTFPECELPPPDLTADALAAWEANKANEWRERLDDTRKRCLDNWDRATRNARARRSDSWQFPPSTDAAPAVESTVDATVDVGG